MRIFTIILFLSLISLSGCTDNTRAKTFGGKATVKLPPNTKLVNVTWKNSNMWYLTRPMREDEEAETLSFQEKSDFGLIEGKVVFEETKSK